MPSLIDSNIQDETIIINYVTTILRRPSQLKIRLIVFGVRHPKQIAGGFDKDIACKQFVAISKKWAQLAANIILYRMDK